MGQLVRTQSQAKAAKKNPKTPLIATFPPANAKSKTKKMSFSMSTRRLAESVEGLKSSLALAAGDLWPKMVALFARAVVKG